MSTVGAMHVDQSGRILRLRLDAAEQAVGQCPIDAETLRILTPLLGGPRDVVAGAEHVLRRLVARGYVRLTPTLCLGRFIGEHQAALTEASEALLRSHAEHLRTVEHLRSIVACLEGPRCVTTGKVRYPDEAAALGAVAALRADGNDRAADARADRAVRDAPFLAYRCVACSTWHVGHKVTRRPGRSR